jgi:hypothetical protein
MERAPMGSTVFDLPAWLIVVLATMLLVTFSLVVLLSQRGTSGDQRAEIIRALAELFRFWGGPRR